MSVAVLKPVPPGSLIGSALVGEYTQAEEAYLRSVFAMAATMNCDDRRRLFWQQGCNGPTFAVRARMMAEYEIEFEAACLSIKADKTDADIWWDAFCIAIPIAAICGLVALLTA
jgi:hypothetical protein